LKDILNLDDRFDELIERIEAEREVIGKNPNGFGPNKGASLTHNLAAHPDITAPSTDAAKQWAGWGSALKPAHEPVVLARKPLDGCTIAENVLRWGCGGLNVDGCRIDTKGEKLSCSTSPPFVKGLTLHKSSTPGIERDGHVGGRWPANFIHSGDECILAEFAKAGTTKSGAMKKEVPAYEGESTTGFLRGRSGPSNQHGDSGSVARFFQSCSFQEEDIPAFAYYAKAGPSERNGSTHPTMKPLSLMRYLCKLITPPGGTILDPFGGSGTTGIAAIKEGFHYILIEQQEEYCEIARKRVAAVPARLDRWAEAEG
jgi:site-specific DNA-methyltransferase (adenine-specific)